MIFEPGEVGVVKGITVKNEGGMPGPGNLTEVYIRSKSMVQTILSAFGIWGNSWLN